MAITMKTRIVNGKTCQQSQASISSCDYQSLIKMLAPRQKSGQASLRELFVLFLYLGAVSVP
jgi:hypothetical protein